MPRRRQTRRERERAPRPAPAALEGRRVEYTLEGRRLSGLVLEANRHRLEGGSITYLRVARDDGFVDIGVPLVGDAMVLEP